jgi:hypothetical protein
MDDFGVNQELQESVPTETVIGNLYLANPTFVPASHQANY